MNGLRQRKHRADDRERAPAQKGSWLVLVVASALGAALVALTAYRLADPSVGRGDTIGNVLSTAAMVFATAGFVSAATRATTDARRSWSWFAAGGIVYLLGELAWGLQSAVGGEPSGNSVADVFWLGALPLFFVGLQIRAQENTPVSARGEGILDSLIVIGLFGIVIGRFVLGELFDPGVPLGEALVGLAYPLADLALLWMLLRGIYRTNARWTAEQGLLAAGLVGLVIGDVLWAAEPGISGATYPDLFYVLAGLALGAAGFAAAGGHARGATPMARVPWSRPLVIDLMPYLAGIAAVGIAFWVDLAGDGDLAVTLAAGAVLLLVLVRLAMAVRQNRRLRREAERRALSDPLTGLRNHRDFQERLSGELARARRAGTTVGLLMIDIDHFKQVNDTIGHLGGDRLLVELGRTLRENSRPGDSPCRVGGDELAVILPGVDDESLVTVARRILAAAAEITLATPDSVEGGYLPVSVSIGACLFPESASDKRDLIEHADRALYRSKREGRGRVTVFDPGASEPPGRDAELAAAERKIKERELDLTRVFRAAPDPLLILSLVGGILDANPAACALSGLSAAQLRERSIWDFLRERDAERVARMLAGTEGDPEDLGEIEITLPDGESRWLEFHGTDFPPDRYVLALRDVTERRAALARLALSERKFHSLFESAADAIYVLDDEGTITDANPAAVELSGRSPEELIGAKVGDLVAPEQQRELQEMIGQLTGDGDARGIFEGAWPDGSYRAVQFSSVANFVPGRHLSIVRDVTELVRARRVAAEREAVLSGSRSGAAGD